MSTSNAERNAFPVYFPGDMTAPEAHYGLTKREWLAGMAMEGLLARGCQVDDTLAKESRLAAELLLAELAGPEGAQ